LDGPGDPYYSATADHDPCYVLPAIRIADIAEVRQVCKQREESAENSQ